ncbi:hypothetical protein [Chitinophaga defluvii]|uniref:Uncharacterized protein n=1 Tax=Chitinophaga defluvii TaxID=3163343 RepID=A0ABV2T6F3_9BACT
MKTVNTVTATQYTAISIGQIILDDSNYLTFWGYLQHPDGWHRCDFVTSYDVLNAMLRNNHHDKSDAVQMTIVQKLEDMRQIPEMIDLEATWGEPVVFDNMAFELTKPCFSEHGNWEEYANEECYFIQKVVALPTTTTLPPAARTNYGPAVDQCLELLCKNYELYLGYIELEFEVEMAREKADLIDDMKYTLAYYAWQQKELNA